jgi:hypothetical protein
MIDPVTTRRILSSFCFVLAVAIVLTVALSALRSARQTDVFVDRCDSYTYCEMGTDIRDARAAGLPVDYFLQDDQTRFLIGKFMQSGIPIPRWGEMVAPHGHHYFPGSGEVGPQYPPGTGWTLSWFPRIGGIRILNELIVLGIAAVTFVLLAFCARRDLPLSCLMIAVIAYGFLFVIQWIDLASFSINATLLPLFLGSILAWLSLVGPRGVQGLFLGIMSGIVFGFVVQDRVISFLLLPTLALIFLPRRLEIAMAFILGAVVSGIFPVLWHDKLITGSWFGSTYNTNDRAQSLASVWTNAIYYYQHAHDTSVYFALWTFFLLCVLIGSMGALAERGAMPWGGWIKDYWGLLLAAPSTIFVSAAFFITQVGKGTYFPIPTMLMICVIMGGIFIMLEAQWRKIDREALARPATCAAAALLALVGAGYICWHNYDAASQVVPVVFAPLEKAQIDFTLPKELQSGRAWLWADKYSGSIRFYTGHPAFKITFGDALTRKMAFDWVKDKGDAQYFVTDSDSMQQLMAEAESWGWKSTYVGLAHGSPCYRMEKP